MTKRKKKDRFWRMGYLGEEIQVYQPSLNYRKPFQKIRPYRYPKVKIDIFVVV